MDEIQVLEADQPPNDPGHQSKISDLPDGEHDELLVYKLSNNSSLGRKVFTSLPILIIINMMVSFISPQFVKEIKQVERKFGNTAAVKKFFHLATTKQFVSGWSHKLLQIIDHCELVELQSLISPNQEDLKDFIARIGIPRGSLLDRLGAIFKKFCGKLLSPMGMRDYYVEDVPVVHPQLCVSVNHFTRNSAFSGDKYGPMEEIHIAYDGAKKVSFDDITRSSTSTHKHRNVFSNILQNIHNSFIMMIGPAGSGKTTMTKRIVRTCNMENKIAFHISFHRLGATHRWNLKNLLLKFPFLLHADTCCPPDDASVDLAFQWVMDNQDKCVLVLDGYDQSSFEISDHPINASPDDQLLPSAMLGLILTRTFLPGIRLILTSRPHSIVHFSARLQPDIVIFVNDLTEIDVRTLMHHYLRTDGTDQILRTLSMKSPRVYQLICNPLFLRLFAMLYSESGVAIWSYVNTAAKLLFELIARHQDSAHHGAERSVDELDSQLAELAYCKTMAGSVVIAREDLERHSLNADDIQDLVFAVMEHQDSGGCNTASVVGFVVFYFHHQAVQEFLTARYGLERLMISEFKVFAKGLFPPIEKEMRHWKVGEDPYMVIRMFTIGCINEQKTRDVDGVEAKMKKEIFLKLLCDHLQNLFVEGPLFAAVLGHQKRIIMDMMDFRDEEIIEEIRHKCESICFWMNLYQFNVVEREIFFNFLQQFVTNGKHLKLDFSDFYGWSESEIRKVFKSIATMKGKIDELLIDMTSSPSMPLVVDLISILPNISNELKLFGNCVHRNYCEEFKSEMLQFDTNTLQTSKLKVQVSKWVGKGTVPVIKATLRKGRKPDVRYQRRGYQT